MAPARVMITALIENRVSLVRAMRMPRWLATTGSSPMTRRARPILAWRTHQAMASVTTIRPSSCQ
ncbi:hypothetical protein D9M68_940500 [compost metagenome]